MIKKIKKTLILTCFILFFVVILNHVKVIYNGGIQMQTCKANCECGAETKRTVNFKGNPLTLIGNEVKPGQKAPDFEVLTNGLAPVKLSNYAGKIKVISVVPSLDTPVCDAQTRRFNEEAVKFNKDVVVLTISMDLPFAQARWCGAAGIKNVETLSDHKMGNFGMAYGVFIAELRLLSRSIFIIDKDDKVVYAEYVPEVTEHPKYEAVLEALKKIK